MAASATFALKAGVWFRRGRRCMISPDSQAIACPLSGRNSTYRPVQISGAGSLCRSPNGNSLAVRLPQAVVEVLKLKEGDEIEITIAGARRFEIGRDRRREQALARLRKYRDRLPAGFNLIG